LIKKEVEKKEYEKIKYSKDNKIISEKRCK
jgi:hypothetical protein